MFTLQDEAKKNERFAPTPSSPEAGSQFGVCKKKISLTFGFLCEKIAALPRGVYCVFWALRAGVLVVFLNISAYLGRLRICVLPGFPNQLFSSPPYP